MTAKKNDKDKPKLHIITYESLVGEARALEFGAKKYSKDNFKSGLEWSRLLDAALRHIYQFAGKEDLDKESSLSHIAHAKANLGMLLYLIENKRGTDDR